ncbi:MAG: DNA-binding protein [Candidatus Omnitrophica bacterium]|nr:DNA-binding protein [Candidatus Omnitrophota bacterium]MDD5549676.1 DNA-binding protein [Candidatus Omnitrophota bacterium]
MKVKSFFFFVMLCLVLIISSSNCYAQISTSSDLLNGTKQYDGKTVNYKGEVIGDVMIRGDHVWLHVNDGTIAIGIWAPKIMIQDILYIGDYHKKGDIVEVSGTFHRSCPEHGGDLDIHASEIKKITSGSTVIRPISRKKVYIGVYSLMLVLIFYALKRFFKNR